MSLRKRPAGADVSPLSLGTELRTFINRSGARPPRSTPLGKRLHRVVGAMVDSIATLLEGAPPCAKPQ
eukprot:384980-Pyramimonas_sp.AAC.1